MRSLDRTTGDVRDALALAVAVGVVGVSFGALATAAGVPLPLTVAMSHAGPRGWGPVPRGGRHRGGRGPGRGRCGRPLLNLRHLPVWAGGREHHRRPLARPGARRAPPHRRGVAFSRARGSGARARRAYWTSGILLARSGTSARCWGSSRARDPRPGRVRRRRGVPGGPARAAAPSLRRSDARRVGLAAAASRWRRRRSSPPASRCSPACWASARRDGRRMTWPALLSLAAGTYLSGSSGCCCAAGPRLPRTSSATSTSAPARCCSPWSR